MMLGPKAYGFPVGGRLKAKGKAKQLATHADVTRNEF
jgi:hypothetical protein